MSVLSLASYASAWRGYEYYTEGKVKNCTQAEDHTYGAEVSGSGGKTYRVHMDPEHPRRSTCDCPHASGRRIQCKHLVAVYFTAFPQEAESYYHDVIAYEEEEERRREEEEDRLIKCVTKMKKEELRQALLTLLFDGPEWQYERFVQEWVEEE